jgi:hypothetical protein
LDRLGDPQQGALTGAFERYRQAVSQQQVGHILAGRKEFSRQGPLSAWVVIWLMMFQRLHRLGTLSVAVRELQCGPIRAFARRRTGLAAEDLSANTSAYSQARSRLPLEVAEKVADVIFESSLGEPQILPGLQGPMFLIDGRTLLLQHSKGRGLTLHRAINMERRTGPLSGCWWRTKWSAGWRCGPAGGRWMV